MFDIILCFIVIYVRSLNYISAANNRLKWKRKEAVVFYSLYFICTYSEEDCSSRGELTDVIKYAAACRITGLASFHPLELTLPSLTREVRTTEDESQKFAYLVLINTCRPNVKSPDYLPNLLCSLDRDGNANSNRSGGTKSSWNIFFRVISVEKRIMFHRTNRCLGCVGYVYVGYGRVCYGDFKYQHWLP